ncbi:MAG: NADPH:quinone oxidoreductase family protein [Gammaproteobacteria bacterium]|nr:NADPH:quinone oxidoreductase family protein [Gammaproteobacteria bacterium]
MQAVLCHQFGNPNVLRYEHLNTKDACPANAVRIEVHTVGVNFADILMVSGEYQRKPPFPFSPGLEAFGVVIECGSAVSRAQVGDRVIAMLDHGAMREELFALERDIVICPPAMDAVTAAAFASVYSTADVALRHRAKLQGGDWLMVHGAGSGVGLAAVEVGKVLGATVIATAGSDEKCALARARGADYTLNYSTGPIRDQILEWTDGKGVDVVFDPVGGDLFKESLRCIAWEGRLVIIGFAAGDRQKIPANILLVKNATAIGFAWTSYRRTQPGIIYDSVDRLFQAWAEGQLQPTISRTLPLQEASQAMTLLQQRKVRGKIVLATDKM